MQNIEIKAKYENLVEAKNIAQKIGARFEGSLYQIDTYFQVKEGRLKLREIIAQETQLIYYERPNVTGAKLSRYQIYSVENTPQLRSILESALGIWCVVEKQREVYWFEEIRIHLDQVKHLGNFLEFEGLIQEDSIKEKVKEKAENLVSLFRIPTSNLIAASYSDLIF